MKTLKQYLVFTLPYLGFLFCLLVFVNYAFTFYMVAMDRPGVNGGIYWYYRLSKETYLLLVGPIAFYSAILTGIFVISILTVRKRVSNILYRHLLVLLLMVTVLEIYLSIIYVGKG